MYINFIDYLYFCSPIVFLLILLERNYVTFIAQAGYQLQTTIFNAQI